MAELLLGLYERERGTLAQKEPTRPVDKPKAGGTMNDERSNNTNVLG